MHQAIAVMPMIGCSGGLPSLRELEDFLELSDRRSARPAGAVSLYVQHESPPYTLQGEKTGLSAHFPQGMQGISAPLVIHPQQTQHRSLHLTSPFRKPTGGVFSPRVG